MVRALHPMMRAAWSIVRSIDTPGLAWTRQGQRARGKGCPVSRDRKFLPGAVMPTARVRPVVMGGDSARQCELLVTCPVEFLSSWVIRYGRRLSRVKGGDCMLTLLITLKIATATLLFVHAALKVRKDLDDN